MRYLWILLFLTLFISCEKSDLIPVEKGISYELAKYRKEQISNIVYDLSFNIPIQKSQPIPAKVTVNFTVKDLNNNLILDFNENSKKLKSIVINGKKSTINHKNEHVIINKSLISLGKNSVTIEFDAGETSLNRNDDFLYTLLVPDRASTLFPCFDQPDLKAQYNLEITAPKDWKVLAGGKLKKWDSKKDFVTHTFATSDLMSTYLFSFVAGKFSQTIQQPKSLPMRFLYRENNKEKIEASVDEVFKIHQNALDFLESYTQIDFPFQKLDFAAIPPFQYGGMEHVGAIQYRQSSLFLDNNATQSRKLSRAKLIAHETAHMWFGDLVTMRWFNDVWMKEVFANYMADKIVNPIYPEVNYGLSFMMSHYPSAYSEDRTKGTNAIRQYLDNLKNAGSLYGRIIYNKAPIMMRQLEHLLGEEQFKNGVQEYLKTYSNANADWTELVEILDKNSDNDIKSWSDVWVNSFGRPIFHEELEKDDNGFITKFILHQKAEDNSTKIWTQSFDIQLINKQGEKKNINIKNIGKSYDLTAQIKEFNTTTILYNTNGFGYGVFPLDKNKLNTYHSIKDEVSRGYQYINVYENMLIGNVSPNETFKLFLQALQNEKNELIANYLSGRLQNIYWTFLTQIQQENIQNILEKTLVFILEDDVDSPLKKTVFDLYKNIAISHLGKENLYDIWNKKKTYKNLFLNENDFTTLAMKLALYNHEKVEEIIATQQKNITNTDRLERFKWLLPTLSKDDNVRDAFMKALLVKENREKESWVQTGLQNIHHPLRQKSAVKHLPLILNKLEEVQLTSDIFFPKGWLASSVGNYSSKEAYLIVQDFIKQNPNYNPNLLQKLWQTTDNLTRAQHIKK